MATGVWGLVGLVLMMSAAWHPLPGLYDLLQFPLGLVINGACAMREGPGRVWPAACFAMAAMHVVAVHVFPG